jgi:7-cyano-7-deazaguanine synthase
MTLKGGTSRPSEPAVVLLSAGLDSSFNLIKALEKFSVRLALTFDYGQRAARREIFHAKALAKKYRVPHKSVALPWFAEFSQTALVGGREVPTGKQVGIDDMKKSRSTAKRVWVPNRNGILLNVAAGFAEGLGAKYIIPGFNIEEAATFPDNSAAFMRALDQSLAFSTANHVKTFCFSTKLNKTQIVKSGLKSRLPFHLLWPCYFSGKAWCGSCESCQRYKRALEANGLSFTRLRKGQL